MNRMSALRQYGAGKNAMVMGDTSPHQRILMLLEGLLEKIAKAKGFMENHMAAEKGHNISLAIAICNGLQASLNHGVDGDIATNLTRLYEYINLRLLTANRDNDPRLLDEVYALVRTVREAWIAIPADLHHLSTDEPPLPVKTGTG